MSGDQWWTQEHENTNEHGETSTHRTRTTGIVWDAIRTHDDNGNRRYRAWVRITQHDGEDVPQVSLWTHNGTTPPPVLTVDEARHLGQALLEAAQLVDDERDAAIRQFLDNTP